MATEKYINKNYEKDALFLIKKSKEILAPYINDGMFVTLRQLFYQLVTLGVVENKKGEYKKLTDTMRDARLSGDIDWDVIIDRTRSLIINDHNDDIQKMVEIAHKNYMIDKWENQKYHCEVWVEKDALIDVIKQSASKEDVGCMSTRGYISVSSLREASKRFLHYIDLGKQVVIFILTDHDPSGKSICTNIIERMNLFTYGGPVEIRRIALTREQVDKYNLPYDYTKTKDPRANGYVGEFGDKCWELDALEPRILSSLISESILSIRDDKLWKEKLEEQESKRTELKKRLGVG